MGTTLGGKGKGKKRKGGWEEEKEFLPQASMSIEICKRCSKKLLVKLYAIQCSIFFGIVFFCGKLHFLLGGKLFQCSCLIVGNGPSAAAGEEEGRERGTKSTTQRGGGSSRQDKEGDNVPLSPPSSFSLTHVPFP